MEGTANAAVLLCCAAERDIGVVKNLTELIVRNGQVHAG
jgi:hypothetical protein